MATAYYPAGNETWTEDKLQNYGGTITWMPYGEIEEEPIVITSQPENYVGLVGDTATFTVEAEGEGLKYQWYASADGGTSWTMTYLGSYNTNKP